MFSKSFEDMRNIDISSYVQERDGHDYLNWADCKAILHDNGAEKVFFEPVVGANGSSLIYTNIDFKDKNDIVNRCYETRIRITVDDKVFEVQYPVMNGSNPVKDNSMSQQRLANSQTRAFVKGVAIHLGLGFDLWCKSEKQEEKESKQDDLSIHNILKIKERLLEEITELLKRGNDNEQIANICQFEDVEEMHRFIKKDFTKIYNIEMRLLKALNDK